MIKLKENWRRNLREVEEQTRKENKAWDKWRALPDHLKWKPTKSSDSDSSDGRFWPFGDGGGMS